MAKLLTVLAQEQETISHFRHLKKINIFLKNFEFIFTILKIHIIKKVTLRSEIVKLS
jgi:hypothetical protein